MRKGHDDDYNKRNISVNSYDTYIPVNEVIVQFSKWLLGTLDLVA
jgi:hypothetical protein